MNLFIDTSNWNLILILEKDNKIIDYIFEKNIQKMSNIAVEKIKQFLNLQSLNIKDIDNIYITLGPGSYTGVRIAATFAKTLKTIDQKYNIYGISSLRFQNGCNDGISILDARGNKDYLGIYTQEKRKEFVLTKKETLEYISKNKLEIYENYGKLDPCTNFLGLKTEFILLENVNDIKPNYIKNFL